MHFLFLVVRSSKSPVIFLVTGSSIIAARMSCLIIFFVSSLFPVLVNSLTDALYGFDSLSLSSEESESNLAFNLGDQDPSAQLSLNEIDLFPENPMFPSEPDYLPLDPSSFSVENDEEDAQQTPYFVANPGASCLLEPLPSKGKMRARESGPMCAPNQKFTGNQKDGESSDSIIHIPKYTDGTKTEDLFPGGFNQYQTNSDGTICAAHVWTVCSSGEGNDLPGTCTQCDPCQSLSFP